MKHIKALSQDLINQIAAGEVIESPAALIKEVIENSIDAKANTISIELENSGFDSIIITDNGDGINKEDLPYIPLRHTTSKISNFDDLYNISTMGFRGEALASIFSISKTTIQSRYKQSEYAYQISTKSYNETQKKYLVEKTSHPNGTTITIKDLFYNVPARLKYLKTHSIELKSILEMVKKILLIHPHLNLTLKNNSKILIQKPYFSSLEENIKSVLSIQQHSDFFEINHSTPHLILSGYLAHTNQLTYSTNKYCYIYVNSRPIESKLIHKAMMNGISTNIALGRFPLYVLHITIDPQLIDVNIHPSKKEVKFEQEHIIYETISKAIENIFSTQLLFKENLNNPNSQNSKINKTLTNENERVTSKVVKQYEKPNYYSNSIQKELKNQLKTELNEDHKLDYSGIEEIELENNLKSESKLKQTIQTPRIVKDEIDNITPTYGPLYEYLKEYRIIGQLHKTYILIETIKGLLIIDQHVAEEKFYYELFKQQFISSQKSSQYLIEPKIKTITQEQIILFEENSSYFSNLGFEIDLISDTQIAIRKVPLNLKGKTIEPDLVLDLIDSLQDFSKSSSSLEEYLIEHFSILSCKSSIRAGDELSFSTMKSIIEQLKVLKEPFNCPHGRPIIVEFKTHDLEKMFNRH